MFKTISLTFSARLCFDCLAVVSETSVRISAFVVHNFSIRKGYQSSWPCLVWSPLTTPSGVHVQNFDLYRTPDSAIAVACDIIENMYILVKKCVYERTFSIKEHVFRPQSFKTHLNKQYCVMLDSVQRLLAEMIHIPLYERNGQTQGYTSNLVGCSNVVLFFLFINAIDLRPTTIVSSYLIKISIRFLISIYVCSICMELLFAYHNNHGLK